jgi:hypothetical protein
MRQRFVTDKSAVVLVLVLGALLNHDLVRSGQAWEMPAVITIIALFVAMGLASGNPPRAS